MKLKRTKLAALAMTALMAVGAMSLVSYAATDATDEAATVADESYTVDPNVVSKYVENDDGTITVYCPQKSASGDTIGYEEFTATASSTVAATCTTGTTVKYAYTYNNVIYYYPVEADDALGHSYTVLKDVVVTAATCTETGLTKTVYVCSRCGEENPNGTVTERVTAANGHTYDESTIYYTAGTNTYIDSNGNPQLSDIATSGTYYVWAYCTVEGKNVQIGTETLNPTGVAYIQIVFGNNVSKIYDSTTGKYVVDGAYYDVTEYGELLTIDENDVLLTKCGSTGTYTINLVSSNKVSILSTQTITVASHHATVTLVEFTSTSDRDKCTVTYNTDGTYTIVNNSCTGTVTYYEVVHCLNTTGCSATKVCASTNGYYVADGTASYLSSLGASHSSLKLLSSTKKTVAATGEHTVDLITKNAVEAAVAVDGVTYVDLYNQFANKTGYYVSFANNTSSCTEDGTVDVQYICTICGEVAKTVNVKVSACGHEWAAATTENLVAATCSSTGSFDSVVYCAHKAINGCTAEKSRTTVLIPRTKHTNELSVTTSGVGTDDVYDTLKSSNITVVFSGDVIVDPGDGEYLTVGSSYDIGEVLSGSVYTHVGNEYYPSSLGAYVYAVSTCSTCGGNAVKIQKDITVTVTSITKEKSNGEAGSITLKAVYTNSNGKTFTTTQTFDYFSTLAAYQGRTVTTLSGLNLDSDGVYRYYINNVVATSYTGFVTYQGGTFFVSGGVLCSGINGLAEYNGTFYYFSNGQLQDQYTGMAEYDGEWFYIKNGVLDTLVNGLVEYNGGTFLIAAGRLVSEANGLYYDFDGKWYFLANGQVQTQFSGVTYYDGAFFKLVNGVLDDSFTGTIEYDGATFNVVAGQLYDQVA